MPAGNRAHTFFIALTCTLSQLVSNSQSGPDAVYAIRIAGNSDELSKTVIQSINSFANVVKQYKDWNFVLTYYSTCNSRQSATAWKRMEAIMNRLVKFHGIKPDRFLLGTNDNLEHINVFHFRPTRDRLENTPHPNLRKKSTVIACPEVIAPANY